MSRPHHHHRGGSAPRAFAIGVGLNVAFVCVEVAFGLSARSMALLADAGHNLGDVLGLVLAWGATWLARRRPSKLRTYGFRRATILAALANAVLLLLATGGVVWESIERLGRPGPVQAKTILVVAAVGVVVNGVSALGFRREGAHDLNLRGAFLHLAADAAVSLVVVGAGVVIHYTGWTLLDPVASLAVSAFVVASAWGLLRKSTNLALDAVPDGVDVDRVRAYLEGLPGVIEVHDLHVWAMSTTENALTAHLVMRDGGGGPRFLGDVCEALHELHGIEHATLQVEAPDAPDPCKLAPDDIV